MGPPKIIQAEQMALGVKYLEVVGAPKSIKTGIRLFHHISSRIINAMGKSHWSLETSIGHEKNRFVA